MLTLFGCKASVAVARRKGMYDMHTVDRTLYILQVITYMYSPVVGSGWGR